MKMKGNRILSLLLILCMVFAALPAVAVQAEAETGDLVPSFQEAPIRVGGVQVTSENATDVLGDGTVSFAVTNGENVLTLNNADESKIPLQAEGGQISETLDNPYTENYGSGYGTFVIGSAAETFAGVEINVGTYAAIFNGGSASYGSLEAGKTYELKNAAGETTGVYEAQESKTTKIHSDTFGFMAMQNANVLNIGEGNLKTGQP